MERDCLKKRFFASLKVPCPNRQIFRFAQNDREVNGTGGLNAASDSLCGEETCAPGGLEIKAAGNCIDIKYFSGEEKAGVLPALHSPGIDFGKGDPAAGDEFLLETAHAGQRIVISAKAGGEAAKR